MPRSQYQDLTFECWRHLGRLGQTPASLCFYQPEVRACEPLLAALAELAAAAQPARVALTLRPCQRPRQITTLRLRLVEETSELRVMHIAAAAGAATIELSPRGLPVFREAIEKWHNQAEDFGVGPLDSELSKRELGARDRASSEAWFWGPGYFAP